LSATRADAIEQQRTEVGSKAPLTVCDNSWYLFCLAIILLQFLLLALDPLPKLYLGDSFSYIWTAISGWIPSDRSFLYGFLIRFSSVWTGSLTSLLIVQTFLGAATAIIIAWICRVIFELPTKPSYLFGFLCSIDPLQLTWQRYVMTETCSLFFYALVVQQSFIYLRDRRLTALLLVQIFSVMTIGFRMNFLILIQVMAVALPVIAHLVQAKPTETVGRWRLQFLKRTLFWQHLAVSVISMFALDGAYQYSCGYLARREPAHLYGTGYFLLAIWAPALQPQDAPDPRLAEIIRHGDEFRMRDIALRSGQLFASDGLVARWCRVETDPRNSSRIAARTALNAFQRDPLGVISLGAKTYFAYWSSHSIKKIAKSDLAVRPFPRDSAFKEILADRFHWEASGTEQQSLTMWYYVAASPWLFVVLLSPLLSLVLLVVGQNKGYALLLFSHSAVLLSGTFLLSVYTIARYLQPLSLLTLLTVALGVKLWRELTHHPSGRAAVVA
jgi:hypothetical protein